MTGDHSTHVLPVNEFDKIPKEAKFATCDHRATFAQSQSRDCFIIHKNYNHCNKKHLNINLPAGFLHTKLKSARALKAEKLLGKQVKLNIPLTLRQETAEKST